MKMRYSKVLLEKNERFSTPLTIAPWEVPVLIEAHGKSLITELGTVEVNRKAVPDARAEFERLSNRYKHGENSEVPYVARVYGVSAVAVKVIEQMIRDSIVDGAGTDASQETGLADEGPSASPSDDVAEISDFAFASGEATPEGVQEIPA